MVAFNACLTRDMMMQALFLRLHISFKAITFKVIFTMQYNLVLFFTQPILQYFLFV